MTDRYENIRQALAMGATPGSWVQDIDGDAAYAMFCCQTAAEAAFIAACDPDTIRELLAERDQLAAALEAVRRDAEPVVRFNDDGTLDEVVGRGQFHLEQMGSGHWWMQLGPHIVNLSARGKIRVHFGRNEAAIDQARGKGGKENSND